MSISTKLIQAAAGNFGEELNFSVVLYDGNSSSNDVTGLGFDPDFVWIKRRTGIGSNSLYDTVRGDYRVLWTDFPNTEVYNTNQVSFISDGFNIAGASITLNQTGDSYVAWCWKAGGTAVTNTDGSITSSVSAKVNAGFSIVGYTGSGTADTVGHGLDQAPELIITKDRDTGASWLVQTSAVDGSWDYLILNSTASKTDLGATWEPTASVMTFASSSTTINNSGSDHIAYCFHSVTGYSKIGTYSGTGSDQYISGLGFQPDFVLIKRTDSTGNWLITDSKRLLSGESKNLYPDLNIAESAGAQITMESDGFSIDGSSGSNNASGGTYIYMAIKGG